MNSQESQLEIQLHSNAATRRNWLEFQGHRERVAQLLQEAAQHHPGTLAIFGAGNCNDLDLPTLAATWSRIELYDLDAEALEYGWKTQIPQGIPDHIHLRIGDLTGAIDLLDQLQHKNIECYQELQARFKQPNLPLGETTATTTLSLCILSQIINSIKVAVTESHPKFVSLVQQARAQHFLTMAQKTQPGGICILVTDFVSSASVPHLAEVAEADLPTLARKLVQEKNFFTGLNPFLLANLLTQPELSPWFTGFPRLTHPWRWNLGPRHYLVCGVIAQRSAQPYAR